MLSPAAPHTYPHIHSQYNSTLLSHHLIFIFFRSLVPALCIPFLQQKSFRRFFKTAGLNVTKAARQALTSHSRRTSSNSHKKQRARMTVLNQTLALLCGKHVDHRTGADDTQRCRRDIAGMLNKHVRGTDGKLPPEPGSTVWTLLQETIRMWAVAKHDQSFFGQRAWNSQCANLRSRLREKGLRLPDYRAPVKLFCFPWWENATVAPGETTRSYGRILTNITTEFGPKHPIVYAVNPMGLYGASVSVAEAASYHAENEFSHLPSPKNEKQIKPLQIPLMVVLTVALNETVTKVINGRDHMYTDGDREHDPQARGYHMTAKVHHPLRTRTCNAPFL